MKHVLSFSDDTLINESTLLLIKKISS